MTQRETAGASRGRRTFGPVALLGLATAGLAAVAGNKTWTEAHRPTGSCNPADLPAGIVWSDFAQRSPLAGAVALVLLAAWGVLLVTRGPVRRAMAVVAVLAAAGYLATAVEAAWSLRDLTERKVAERIGHVAGCGQARVWMSDTWWHTALATGVVALLVAVLAVVLAPHWPEMGSRYDAPTQGEGPAGVPLEQQSSIDLWKSLDAGHDPTRDPDDHDSPQA
ncbi:Trp biosynthesis-associated membrane protein [Nocardioides jiangxiensis]|uniref:Trp biosynthesis-associated membrane protein n=1 Tax=Nocardioides jiangxiensis TaxID=3064524 RepID=A0ABT9B3G0_9ACTN|nr:Trp biosynthesis-associated membrane protein [Nocardioides sp. WY-20]MDO7869382.1 Trp biosynthesis-associated membrane protein [Nocardioides sp. WY-20]